MMVCIPNPRIPQCAVLSLPSGMQVEGGWGSQKLTLDNVCALVFIFIFLNPPTRQVGDWTQELFRLGLEQPRLPLWITAAQPSLMEKSIYYDNGKEIGRTNPAPFAVTATTVQDFF